MKDDLRYVLNEIKSSESLDELDLAALISYADEGAARIISSLNERHREQFVAHVTRLYSAKEIYDPHGYFESIEELRAVLAKVISASETYKINRKKFVETMVEFGKQILNEDITSKT